MRPEVVHMYMFPIQATLPGQLRSMPWEIVQPHEAQALRNHCGQSLLRLAERGGLEAREMVAVLEDKDYRTKWPALPAARSEMDAESAKADMELRRLIAAFYLEVQTSAALRPPPSVLRPPSSPGS